MVFNTAELRRYRRVAACTANRSLSTTIRYSEQRLGRIVYLPADWNVTHNIFGRAEKLYQWRK